MILLASLAIRATILAVLVVSGLAALEFHGVAFRGYRFGTKEKPYVPTDLFGDMHPWAFLVYAGCVILLGLASVAFLAFLDFSLNA